jgi:hypothetical protein
VTLRELSVFYLDSAAAIRLRMKKLRTEAKTLEDEEAVRAIRRRIADLAPILRETHELAELTAHYYDRGYFRNAKYTL